MDSLQKAPPRATDYFLITASHIMTLIPLDVPDVTTVTKVEPGVVMIAEPLFLYEVPSRRRRDGYSSPISTVTGIIVLHLGKRWLTEIDTDALEALIKMSD